MHCSVWCQFASCFKREGLEVVLVLSFACSVEFLCEFPCAGLWVLVSSTEWATHTSPCWGMQVQVGSSLSLSLSHTPHSLFLPTIESRTIFNVSLPHGRQWENRRRHSGARESDRVKNKRAAWRSSWQCRAEMAIANLSMVSAAVPCFMDLFMCKWLKRPEKQSTFQGDLDVATKWHS